MTMRGMFDETLFTITLEDIMVDINEIITEAAPEGKTVTDFTGGYIQQLKNSTQFVAYYGTKEGTKNRSTAKITIADNEIDTYYMMLKAKIHDMKRNGAKTPTIISLAERRLRRKLKTSTNSADEI